MCGSDPLTRNIVLTYKKYKYVTKLLHNMFPQTLNTNIKYFSKQNWIAHKNRNIVYR